MCFIRKKVLVNLDGIFHLAWFIFTRIINITDLCMRIITYNVNGIRAAVKKGFVEWLGRHPADIICLQEIKANREDIDIAAIENAGYRSWWFSAQKKGYSGVAILSSLSPEHVEYGHGKEQSDFEGRVIRADFGDITIINAYFP